jgi:hypothetical protein
MHHLLGKCLTALLFNANLIAMIKRGEIQRNDSIDFLDNLDFDFFKSDNVHSNSIVDDDMQFGGISGGATQHQPFSQGTQNPTLMQQHRPDEFSFDQQFDDEHGDAVSGRYPSSDAVPSYSNFGIKKGGDGAAFSSNHYISRPRNASIDSLVSFMSRRDSYDVDADAYTAGSLGDTTFGSVGGGHRKSAAARGQQQSMRSGRPPAPGAPQQGSGRFANVFDEDNEASYFQQFQNMQDDFPSFDSASGDKGQKSEKLSKAQQKQQAAAVLKSSLQKGGDTRCDDGSQGASQNGIQNARMGGQDRPQPSGDFGSNSNVYILSGTDGFAAADPQSGGHGYMLAPQGQGENSPSQGSAFIGVYSAEARKQRIERFLEKRNRRVWTKRVKYDVRKNFADSRIRVKGRFVKKEDEDLLRVIKDINEEN